jgi:two-component system sensor histidine kinase ChvG
MNAPAARLARPRPLRYPRLASLATRIMVVNLLALLALAGGLFYLDNFRARLIETRAQELASQGEIMAAFLARLPDAEQPAAIAAFQTPRGTRARLYAPDGRLAADNWADPATPRFVLEDPTTEGFRRQSAIVIDRVVDFFTGQPELPLLPDADSGTRAQWPEAERAALGAPAMQARMTADRLVVLQSAVPLPAEPGRTRAVLLLTVDTPDVIDLVRRERAASFLVALSVLGFSLGLSAYLARTIVIPLRQLALAAHRVRLGRARDVVVPRLPHRRDEIGALARALADMTATLRQRIDATEAFAADVAHELKNPLASLRSAVEALGAVKDPAARRQLFAVIEEDVGRIDRLITDISAASRLDAELSRARLQAVDAGQLAAGLVSTRRSVGPEGGIRVEVTAPPAGTAMVAADPDRLGQVLNNLVDNAVSFSPEDGRVAIEVARDGELVRLAVEDEGPGVPAEARDAVFERFYSERPGHEDYGRHSGLGLSIARAIVESMDGRIAVADRLDGRPGARFTVTLPAL